MNNNNRGNNRRRGRGGNRSQGGGQTNRIDSRARGNAPQLLEKYRKMAHDSALNGDRVQAEYYLQFADHYFRVIADGRAQKDDSRPRRDAERDYRGEDDYDDFEDESPERAPRAERPRQPEFERDDEGERESREAEEQQGEDNPFARDTRGRSRRGRRPEPRGQGAEEVSEGGLDPSILPPAIGRDADEAGPAGTEDEAAAEARPRRRTRKPRAADRGDEETLAVVS